MPAQMIVQHGNPIADVPLRAGLNGRHAAQTQYLKDIRERFDHYLLKDSWPPPHGMQD